jgi:AcrR family transcriptional regulator
VAEPAGAPRVRDPARKEKILAAAAALIARDGYHSVSMAEIGAEAGITGSGIYRHFGSKAAILVAIFDRVMDELLTDEQRIVESQLDRARALDLLIDGQVEFVVGSRVIAQVYHNEIANLPAVDRSRLRRKQRQYVQDWVRVVGLLRPELEDEYARSLVHAAISGIQSSLFHTVGLAEDQLRVLLADVARGTICSTSPPA